MLVTFSTSTGTCIGAGKCTGALMAGEEAGGPGGRCCMWCRWRWRSRCSSCCICSRMSSWRMPTRDTMAGGRGGRAAAAQSSPKDGVIAANMENRQVWGSKVGKKTPKNPKQNTEYSMLDMHVGFYMTWMHLSRTCIKHGRWDVLNRLIKHIL